MLVAKECGDFEILLVDNGSTDGSERLCREYEAQRIANQMANLQYILSKYQYSGNTDTPISENDAVAMGLSRKDDGTYPTIKEIQEVYARLQAAASLIGWNDYGKQEAIDTWKISNGLYGG